MFDAKGILIEDSNNYGRRFSNKGKHSKKKGGKQTKIIHKEASLENDKSLVLYVHAK